LWLNDVALVDSKTVLQLTPMLFEFQFLGFIHGEDVDCLFTATASPSKPCTGSSGRLPWECARTAWHRSHSSDDFIYYQLDLDTRRCCAAL